MKAEYKYFHFELVPSTAKKKTQTWFCYSNSSKDTLGVVKWFGRWRQYCFFPEDETVFNSTCLDDIKSFLVEINAEYKARKEENGNNKCI